MEAANQQRDAANGSWFVKWVFVSFLLFRLFVSCSAGSLEMEPFQNVLVNLGNKSPGQ